MGPCPPLHILTLEQDTLEHGCVLNTSKVTYSKELMLFMRIIIQNILLFWIHDGDGVPCSIQS